MKTAAREITERFSKSRMAGACVSAITGPLPDAPSGPQETARSSGSVRGKPTHWRLAPWCYAEGDAIYHDYLCRFASFPRLTAALAEDRGAVSKPQPGELAEEFEKAVRDGFLVPSL
jgi:hypothetical protein